MRKRILTAVMCCVMGFVACLGFTACGDSDGSELQGFDIDLAKAVCADLGVEARFQKISWSAKFTELSSKNIDLIWNGMTITDEVKENCAVSEPYMNNKQVAVVKKDKLADFSTTDQIKAATLAAESGSAGAKVIEANFKDSTSIITESQADALNEVAAGTSDVAIIDAIMAGYYTNTGDYKNTLAIVPDVEFDEEQYGIAARKGETGLIDKVNSSLAKLSKSGEVKKIADVYGLGNDIIDCGEYTSTGATDGWDYIQERGKIIIGYTVFAPIAFAK